MYKGIKNELQGIVFHRNLTTTGLIDWQAESHWLK